MNCFISYLYKFTDVIKLPSCLKIKDFNKIRLISCTLISLLQVSANVMQYLSSAQLFEGRLALTTSNLVDKKNDTENTF